MQAAILRVRLPYLAAWTARRRAIAARYRTKLSGATGVEPTPECDAGHVYHLFVVRSGERERLMASLAGRGIETLIHYPVPIPRQPALAGAQPADCPIAERACDEVLSLPLHPHLSDGEVDDVAGAIGATVQSKGCGECRH
jgi:dTDP-3-amino-3,4,6-trideoxy-alpha-D-glucose transaminase